MPDGLVEGFEHLREMAVKNLVQSVGIVPVLPYGDPVIFRRSLAAKDRPAGVQPSSARLVEPSGFSSTTLSANKKSDLHGFTNFD
ncbi:MAG: hypothetical protein Q8L39_12210 [Burkholderiales bacterium]|nr:hypothetical protein [Burkholderiales bacterium]